MLAMQVVVCSVTLADVSMMAVARVSTARQNYMLGPTVASVKVAISG